MKSLEDLSAAGIAFMGDPHGVFEPARQLTTESGVSALVLLGDMELEAPLEQVVADVPAEVWWIHGNHDADDVRCYDHLFESALADCSLHGRVVEINGVRIAGLGGVFRQKIWHPDTGIQFPDRRAYLGACERKALWRGGLPCRQRASLWHEDYTRLARLRADVLVTHEAPSCHRHGFAVLDELAQQMGVSLVVHGHHHEQYQATICGGRIPVLGVGLAHVARLTGEVLMRPDIASRYLDR